MKKDHRAFTLAEVLITLAIIGVVAAMTIPALINNTYKQENATALKKTFSILSQATNMVIASQGGGPDAWNIVDGSDTSTNLVMDLYKPYLRNIKACNSSNSACFYSNTLLQLNGTPGNYTAHPDWADMFGANTSSWILSDGTFLNFDMKSGGELGTYGITADYSAASYGFFSVDINGNKSPNQFGRDVFVFVIGKNGLIPAGKNNNSANCSVSSSGRDCASKVLIEGAINY